MKTDNFKKCQSSYIINISVNKNNFINKLITINIQLSSNITFSYSYFL